jgi:hypothetical protein
MVHVTLFGRIFEVDLRSPHAPPRCWSEGRWVRDSSLSNEDVLFDSAARGSPAAVSSWRMTRSSAFGGPDAKGGREPRQ